MESCSGVNWSVSAQALADSVTCRHFVFGRGKSEGKTETANKRVPLSPVAKKHSVEQSVRVDREYRERH